MVRSKFTPEQKIWIVESLRTSISAAGLCRRHNVHPHTFIIHTCANFFFKYA